MTGSTIKSRPHHHMSLLLPNQGPHQVSTSYALQFLRYSLEKILKVRVTMARSKVKSRPHYDVTHLHPQPMSLPNINFLHLTGSEIQAMPKPNVKSRSHHDVAHLHPQPMYRPGINFFPRYSPYKILRVKITTPSQRSNQDHTKMLHTYTPQRLSLPSVNLLHLTESEK